MDEGARETTSSCCMRNDKDPLRGPAGQEEPLRRDEVIVRFRASRPDDIEEFLRRELRLAFWRGYEARRDVEYLILE